MRPAEWFQLAFWRNRGADQRAVLDQWSRLKQLHLVLEDIALRGGVMAPAKSANPAAPPSEIDILIHEGRRQLALEIIKLAGCDPLALWRSIEAAQIDPTPSPDKNRRIDR